MKKSYMKRKLHIGGETQHPEWEIFNIQPGEHIDHVGDAQDLSRFEDKTFDEIYASHILEHFDYTGSLQKALKDWHRVLKPEGKLYISTPDMDALCKLFLMRERLSEENRFQIMRMMFGGHIDKYDYHYVGLNADIMKCYLAEAGFQRFRQIEDFGLFEDASRIRVGDVLISLNIIALK